MTKKAHKNGKRKNLRIPDAVAMKNRIQAKLYKQSKDLNPDELIAFYREKAKAFPFKKTG